MKKSVQHLLQLVPLELLVTALMFLLALFGFSFIVHEAVLEKEDVFDQRVIHFFATHASRSFVVLMDKITFLGSSSFLLPAYLVLIAWLIKKKKTANAIDTAVIGISSTAMMFALKTVFHRHRPELPVIKAIGGYSFPSGHSLSSFVFAAILIYLVWQSNLTSAKKYLAVCLLSLFPLLIGLSRIVLNVHYATDVIGGFCAGIVWVVLSFWILKRIRRQAPVTNDAAGV